MSETIRSSYRKFKLFICLFVVSFISCSKVRRLINTTVNRARFTNILGISEVIRFLCFGKHSFEVCCIFRIWRILTHNLWSQHIFDHLRMSAYLEDAARSKVITFHESTKVCKLNSRDFFSMTFGKRKQDRKQFWFQAYRWNSNFLFCFHIL